MSRPTDHASAADGRPLTPAVISDWASVTPPAPGNGYDEILARPTLSVGRFTARPGHEDSQAPHTEDEVYFVTTGNAELLIDDTRHSMTAGSIAYIPAGTPHRFTNITQALEVLVFFAPAPQGDRRAG